MPGILSKTRTTLEMIKWDHSICARLSIGLESGSLFGLDPIQACGQLYGPNPFPEAIRVADYIRARSEKDARIAVLGSEPEIYFYAHRHRSEEHIYMYGLMEAQPYALTMQDEMIGELEKTAPQYVVRVSGHASWLEH